MISARELARILVAERDAGDDWQGVVASDLARARETAEVVAQAHGSMRRESDMDAFAEALARFFEQAQASAASRSITVT